MDISYLSHEDKSADQANAYSKITLGSDFYLPYRDIPIFINKYVHGKKALDYGAGTGISTEFLQTQGLDVTGVDISEQMLAQASLKCPTVPFHLITNQKIPLASSTCDLVFSSFVLFELGSEQIILTYLKEAMRVMKDDGVFIAVTGSQDMYSKNWLRSGTDFPENKNLKSGGLAKIYLRTTGIEFTNFYWTEADYRQFFTKAGFQLMEVHYPLGKNSEPQPWKEELTSSAFVIFVAKKNLQH